MNINHPELKEVKTLHNELNDSIWYMKQKLKNLESTVCLYPDDEETLSNLEQLNQLLEQTELKINQTSISIMELKNRNIVTL
jgi:hypothetical protein